MALAHYHYCLLSLSSVLIVVVNNVRCLCGNCDIHALLSWFFFLLSFCCWFGKRYIVVSFRHFKIAMFFLYQTHVNIHQMKMCFFRTKSRQRVREREMEQILSLVHFRIYNAIQRFTFSTRSHLEWKEKVKKKIDNGIHKRRLCACGAFAWFSSAVCPVNCDAASYWWNSRANEVRSLRLSRCWINVEHILTRGIKQILIGFKCVCWTEHKCEKKKKK